VIYEKMGHGDVEGCELKREVMRHTACFTASPCVPALMHHQSRGFSLGVQSSFR